MRRISALGDDMYGKIYNLLSQTSRHPKIVKNSKVGILGAIMHLAPADDSGYEVCPMRSKGCTEACLNQAGFHYAKIQRARINRTKMFFEDRDKFMLMLAKEIRNLCNRAEKKGFIPGVRLNGTSDIPWERIPHSTYPNMMAAFPKVKFMDYTKRWNRKNLPANYRLIFSRSEDNYKHCVAALENGMNIAVVFLDTLPKKASIGGQVLRVIDGDEHDWRYGDYDDYPDERVIVGLRAKGLKAKQDTSGFVLNIKKQVAA